MPEAAAQEPTVEEELEVAEFLEDDEEGDGEVDLDSEDEEGGEGPPTRERAPVQEKKSEPPSPELRALQEQNENLKGWAGRMRHENRTLLERVEKGEARLARLLEAMAKAQGVKVEDLETPPGERIPDEDEDFAGHVEGRVRKSVQAELQKFYDTLQGRDAQKDVEGRVGQVKQYHEADIARFEQQYPDYDAAEAFVIEATAKDIERGIRRMNPRMPDAQVQEATQQLLLDTVARHQLQFAMDGASLAEYVYRQALEGGYQPNGARPAAKKPARGGSADDLRERRRKAGTSLAAVSGSPGGGKGLERLMDMDDDEYAAAMDKIEQSGKDFEQVARKILA